MGTAECIIYAYDLSTVPSVLPAFANARDLIIVDEVNRTHFAINSSTSRYAALSMYWANEMHNCQRPFSSV